MIPLETSIHPAPSNQLTIFWEHFYPTSYTHNANYHKCISLHESQCLDFFPGKQLELILTESTTRISPWTGTARIILLSLPNQIFLNFSHKPHFRNAIPHSVKSVKIRSVPMVWIFFLSTNRNFFQRNQLRASTLRSEPHRHSIYLFQNRIFLNFFSQATFPQCYITECQKLQNSVSSDGLDFFPINKPELFSTESTRGIPTRIGTA